MAKPEGVEKPAIYGSPRFGSNEMGCSITDSFQNKDKFRFWYKFAKLEWRTHLAFRCENERTRKWSRIRSFFSLMAKDGPIKLALGKVVSIFVVAGGWLLIGVRGVLDLIGYSTAPEDIEVVTTRFDQFLAWLLSLPWWSIWGFVLVVTLWLMRVSWPRSNKDQPIPEIKIDRDSQQKDNDIIESESPETAPPEQEEATDSQLPNSLQELFKGDFSNTMKLGIEIPVRVEDEYNSIKASLNRDFSSGSEFLVFYIPNLEETYKICIELISEYNLIMEKLVGGIEIISKDPGDLTSIGHSDFLFTNHIYIYHEKEMSLEQLGNIEAMYKENGLFVHFRSTGYVTTRWFQDRVSIRPQV